MRLLLSSLGIQLRLSCPYTSQQNGKAERILRTTNDCVRTLLIHSAAPLPFWAEALATATYLINRRPCRATADATPYSLLFSVPATYDELRVFGCRCYPNMISTSANKLAPRSTMCVFIGYPADHRGYRCYNINTGPSSHHDTSSSMKRPSPSATSTSARLHPTLHRFQLMTTRHHASSPT
jgi:hypothetical protein